MHHLAITTYTSLSFSVVALIAFLKNAWFLGATWQMLYGVSVLNHAKAYDTYIGVSIVKRVDTILAHMITFQSILFSIVNEINPLCLMIFYICLGYIVCVYYLIGASHRPHGSWELWHASLHVSTIVGETCLLLGCPST
jgi:hypothetical protein